MRANTPNPQDEQDHEASDLLANRCAEATELLNYLWDNYIELANSTHLFLLGTNVGHIAITQWIKTHETVAMERVDRTIHFIEDVDLQACRSATNDMLAPWYYRTSIIYLSAGHNFWESVFASTKPKKKFGFVVKRSPESSAVHISDMLLEQKDEVMGALLEETKEWRSSRPFAVDDDDDDEGIVGGSEDMEISEADPLPGAAGASFKKLPPVGNFALSPAPRSSPAGPGSRTPSALSPTRGSAAR